MIVAPTTVLVDPTADLQAAIDALGSGGGIVQLGPGTYPLITVGLTVPYGVTLAGSGMGTTYLEMDNPNTDIVTVTGAYATVRDLTITVKASARAAGTGVGLKLKASSSALMSECEFKNLNIFSTGSWGIKICDISNTYEPADYSLGYIVGPGFSHVTVFDCRSGGALYSGAGVSTPKFHYFSSVCKGYRPAWPSRPSGAWKWPPMDAYGIGFTDYLPAGAVYLFITTDATFDKCFFQSHTDSDNTPAISIEDCISTAFNDCYFEHLNSTTRTARWVTISHSQNFSFKNTYVRNAQDTPLHFMLTSQTDASSCSGLVDGLWATSGATTDTNRLDDFYFNSTNDAKAFGPIRIDNIHINDAVLQDRPVSIRHRFDTSVFVDQHVTTSNVSDYRNGGWEPVLANAVSYEDDYVMYEDEVVTY